MKVHYRDDRIEIENDHALKLIFDRHNGRYDLQYC